MSDIDYNLLTDLRVKYVSVTLTNAPNYSTKFNLQSTRINMQCGYNYRNKLRWVILTDDSGNVLLPQTFLKFKKRCELNFEAEVLDLDYYITLKPKKSFFSIAEDYDYLNWANDFDICFVGHEYSLTKRMDANGRRVFVGN